LLDLVVSEFHQHSVSAGIWIPKQSCPLPNAKCEARSASRTNLDGRSAFRAQKVGVHEQPVKEDFDSTRNVLRKLTHGRHAVKIMSRFGRETALWQIGTRAALNGTTLPRSGLPASPRFSLVPFARYSSKWIANQPRHRLEIYERNLDWFRFWLKQEEDPDPTKTKQYLRRRRLRDGAPN